MGQLNAAWIEGFQEEEATRRRFWERIELMGCLVSRRKMRELGEGLLMEGRKLKE